MSNSAIGSYEWFRHTLMEPVPERNHVTNFFGSFKGTDTFLKWTIAVLQIPEAILNASPHADPQARADLGKTVYLFGVARTVAAFFNGWRGAFPGAIANVRQGCQLGAEWNSRKLTRVYNVNMCEEINYRGRTEKTLGMVSQACAFVGAMTYWIGFSFLAPIRFADAEFQGRINQSAKAIGGKFQFLMVINHISGIFGCLIDFAHLGHVYSHTFAGDSASKGYKAERTKQHFNAFVDRFAKVMVVFLMKCCETGIDVVTFFRVHAPLGVKLGLNLVSTTLDLYATIHMLRPKVKPPEASAAA